MNNNDKTKLENFLSEKYKYICMYFFNPSIVYFYLIYKIF